MKRMALKACQNGLRRLLAGVVALMLMPGDGVLVAQPQDSSQGQDSSQETGSEASARATRFSGCTDCTLS